MAVNVMTANERAATGRQYSEYIDAKELGCWFAAFNKGIYLRIATASLTTATSLRAVAYKIGQRVVINDTAVREYLEGSRKSLRAAWQRTQSGARRRRKLSSEPRSA